MTTYTDNTKFHDWRKARGYTMRKVARMCQVSPDTVSKWDRGRNPYNATIERVCALLGLPPVTFGWHLRKKYNDAGRIVKLTREHVGIMLMLYKIGDLQRAGLMAISAEHGVA